LNLTGIFQMEVLGNGNGTYIVLIKVTPAQKDNHWSLLLGSMYI